MFRQNNGTKYTLNISFSYTTPASSNYRVVQEVNDPATLDIDHQLSMKIITLNL